MKINAGLYKNRNIKRTNLETTRETSDLVKQAIFNMVGPFFYEKQVGLDLFSGSGSLGLEALSRGMSFVYFNDLNKNACSVVKDNLNTLKIESIKYSLTNLDYKVLLNQIDKKIDYIFLDPPYDIKDTKGLLKEIIDANILNNKAIIVFEMHKETDHNNDLPFEIIKEKNYGIKKIVVYKYI